MVTTERKQILVDTVAANATKYTVEERVNRALNSVSRGELLILACDPDSRVIRALLDNATAPDKALALIAARIMKYSEGGIRFQDIADKIIAHQNTPEDTRNTLNSHFYNSRNRVGIFDMLRESFA